MSRTAVRSGLLTVSLLGIVIVAAVLASSASVRITDVAVGDCFVYDRSERILSVDPVACDDALAIVADDPDDAVAALVVWRGTIAEVSVDPMEAIDEACGSFRDASPVVVPVVFEEPAADGAAGLCLALGR